MYREREQREILEDIVSELKTMNEKLESLDKTLVALVEAVMNK